MLRGFLVLLASLSFANICMGAAIQLDGSAIKGLRFGTSTGWYIGDERIETVSQESFAEQYTLGKQELISRGYIARGKKIWYRLQFHNPSQLAKTIYLHSDTTRYEIKVFHNAKPVGVIKEKVTLDQRILPLEVGPKETKTFILELDSLSIAKNMWTFWGDKSDLLQYIEANRGNLNILVSIFGMSFLFNLMLLIAYRARVYVYYGFYILTNVILIEAVWGYRELFSIDVYGIVVVATISLITTSLFTIDFLNLRNTKGRYYSAMKVLMGIILIASLLNIAIRPVNYVSSALILLTTLTCMGCSAHLYWKKRDIYVLIYMLAFGVMLGSASLQLFRWFLGIDAISRYFIFYAIAVENIVMLIALGIKIWSTEKVRQRQQHQLDHSYAQIAKSFYPHQLRMIREGKNLEDTMPCDTTSAVILAFDVINSSKIEESLCKELFELFFKSSQKIVSENYCEHTLRSRGFVIKELGDGLLASVGFPFPVNSQKPAEEIAISLAEDLLTKFDDCVKQILRKDGVFACIGIAKGSVEGSFSLAGTVRYDMFGRGIVLATRYESIRKLVAVDDDRSHLIFVQDRVAEEFSQSHRDLFETLDLKQKSITIRDDPDAKHLYFRRFHPGDRLSPQIDDQAIGA